MEEGNVNLDCLHMPTLSHMAVTRISVALWTRKDVKRHMRKMDTFLKSWKWNRRYKLKETLRKKVKELPIPTSLQMKVNSAVVGIGFELTSPFFDRIHALNQFKDWKKCWIEYVRWTPYGSVDAQKTVKEFLKANCFSNSSRYELACDYFCDDFIEPLWNNLTETEISQIFKSNFPIRGKQFPLVFYSTPKFLEAMKENRPDVDVESYFTLKSIRDDNLVAFQHFWHQLNEIDRVDRITSYLSVSVRDLNPLGWCTRIGNLFGGEFFHVSLSMIFPFLLSQANSEQKSCVEDLHFAVVIFLIECWFGHELFLQVVRPLLKTIGAYHLSLVLKIILLKVIESDEWEGEKYRMWVFELWNQSCESFKEYFLCTPIPFLFDECNFACLKLVLQSADMEAVKKRFYYDHYKRDFSELIENGQVKHVDRILNYCFSSQKEIQRYKKMLKKKDSSCKMS